MNTFLPTDLLLPRDCDLMLWAVIASDQFTSNSQYWQNVEETVGRAPSTLRMVLPESCLDGPDIETDIMASNAVMSEYLRGGLFQTFEESMFYVERTLPDGKIRRGLIGMIDLEEFDYALGATSPMRAGELTITPRIPPRMAARKNAPLEVSHVILLADDSQNLIFNDIAPDSLKPLYDTKLMAEGGSVRAWLLGEDEINQIKGVTGQFSDPYYFQNKYQVGADVPILQFAVADGNHSLATAKECYERQKRFVSPDDWKTLPARYALVELVNLYDDGVSLNSFHRVISGVNPHELLRNFRVYLENLPESDFDSQDFPFVTGEQEAVFSARNPVSKMEVSTLQSFLDDYLKHQEKAHLDYILDEDEARNLAKKANTISFILPNLHKEHFFATLVKEGALPRKSYSLGAPEHKRYYLEARKIR